MKELIHAVPLRRENTLSILKTSLALRKIGKCPRKIPAKEGGRSNSHGFPSRRVFALLPGIKQPVQAAQPPAILLARTIAVHRTRRTAEVVPRAATHTTQRTATGRRHSHCYRPNAILHCFSLLTRRERESKPRQSEKTEKTNAKFPRDQRHCPPGWAFRGEQVRRLNAPSPNRFNPLLPFSPAAPFGWSVVHFLMIS